MAADQVGVATARRHTVFNLQPAHPSKALPTGGNWGGVLGRSHCPQDFVGSLESKPQSGDALWVLMEEETGKGRRFARAARQRWTGPHRGAGFSPPPRPNHRLAYGIQLRSGLRGRTRLWVEKPPQCPAKRGVQAENDYEPCFSWASAFSQYSTSRPGGRPACSQSV